jgi:hypothetical protein
MKRFDYQRLSHAGICFDYCSRSRFLSYPLNLQNSLSHTKPLKLVLCFTTFITQTLKMDVREFIRGHIVSTASCQPKDIQIGTSQKLF